MKPLSEETAQFLAAAKGMLAVQMKYRESAVQDMQKVSDFSLTVKPSSLTTKIIEESYQHAEAKFLNHSKKANLLEEIINLFETSK